MSELTTTTPRTTIQAPPPPPPPGAGQAAPPPADAPPPPEGDYVDRSANAGVDMLFAELADAPPLPPKPDRPSGDADAKKAHGGLAAAAARAADLARFDARVATLKQHPAYKALSADGKKTADEIMNTARGKDNRQYYADKLELLFNTPDAPPAAVSANNAADVQVSLQESKDRMKTADAKANLDKEEKISGDAARKWTTVSGDGATYQVDRSDVNNVVVKMKVHVTGKAADVANTKALEDDIEKKAATHGYTLDIEFVDHDGADVFTVGANPEEWTTSGNWVGSTFDIAHEAHHLLGLDDRYDYIESHADNADMDMETRLHWFNVQIKKPYDVNGKFSIMGDGSKPLHDDVCKVAQVPDEKACVDTRTTTHGGK